MRPLTRTAKPGGREGARLGSGRREHDQQDADEEQQRQDQDRLATPDGVEMIPADQGTDRGGEQQRVMTTPSCSSESPSSLAIGPSAPLATPVS